MKPGISIVSRLSLGFLLLVLSVDEEAVSGVIGSSVVAASAIPVWYRALKNRLSAPRPNRAVNEGLEDRIYELEGRHREELADLEERIDFAERLLTKQRDQLSP